MKEVSLVFGEKQEEYPDLSSLPSLESIHILYKRELELKHLQVFMEENTDWFAPKLKSLTGRVRMTEEKLGDFFLLLSKCVNLESLTMRTVIKTKESAERIQAALRNSFKALSNLKKLNLSEDNEHYSILSLLDPRSILNLRDLEISINSKNNGEVFFDGIVKLVPHLNDLTSLKIDFNGQKMILAKDSILRLFKLLTKFKKLESFGLKCNCKEPISIAELHEIEYNLVQLTSLRVLSLDLFKDSSYAENFQKIILSNVELLRRLKSISINSFRSLDENIELMMDDYVYQEMWEYGWES